MPSTSSMPQAAQTLRHSKAYSQHPKQAPHAAGRLSLEPDIPSIPIFHPSIPILHPNTPSIPICTSMPGVPACPACLECPAGPEFHLSSPRRCEGATMLCLIPPHVNPSTPNLLDTAGGLASCQRLAKTLQIPKSPNFRLCNPLQPAAMANVSGTVHFRDDLPTATPTPFCSRQSSRPSPLPELAKVPMSRESQQSSKLHVLPTSSCPLSHISEMIMAALYPIRLLG